MSRRPRLMSSSGIYHIILRSINQHIIFEEDSDYRKFLFILSDCKEKYEVDIYAYCLMDNHIHLLMRAADENLPLFFQSLGVRFVHWYNTKYSRVGYLFQDRYHSVPIENRRAFLNVLVYIHNNPVKANVCRIPSEYKWSSFNAYYGAKDTRVNVEFAGKVAGTKELLMQYFARSNPKEEDAAFAFEHEGLPYYISDDKALEIFKSVTGLSSTSELSRIAKPKRNEYIRILRQHRLKFKQIARLMDVSEPTVRRVCKK